MRDRLKHLKLDIFEVAEKLDLVLEQDGDRQRCRCPIHSDNNPSLVLYPEHNWFCFGCQQGGDVLDLVKFIRQCDEVEARNFLGIEPDEDVDILIARLREGQEILAEGRSDPYHLIERVELARRCRIGDVSHLDLKKLDTSY